MKKLFLTTALLALIASPVLAADNTVSSEYRMGTGKGAQPSEYVLDYQAPFFQIFPNLNYGIESAVKQQPHNGADVAKLVGRVGVSMPAALGFTLNGNVQLGKDLEASTSSVVAGKTVVKGGDYNLYGAQVGVSRDLFAGVKADAGYRYRNGIESKGLDNQETRLNAGLSYELLPSWNAGVEYYRYSNEANPIQKTALAEQVAFKVSHSF